LIKFFTNTFLLTALGAGFLYAETCYHLNIDIYRIPDQLIFIILATLGLYNSIQVLSSVFYKQTPKNPLFIVQLILSLVSAAYCGWFLKDLEIDSLIFIGHLVLIGVAYVLPVFGKPLRELPFLKILIIVYVWTTATVILPIRLNLWNSDVFYAVLYNRLIFVFMLSLAFDMCHRAVDIKDSLATLPTVFGTKISYLAIPLGILGIVTSLNISPQYGVIMAVIDFSTAILLFQSPSLSQSKLFEILLDTVMYLKFLLLYWSTKIG